MPKQVDRGERREAISEAVWRVVAERGMDGLTLRAVAAAAGCTTGMVTHYFRDKKALLAHARSLMHRRMAGRIDALAAQGTARGTLRAVCEQALPLDEERRLEAVVWAYFQLSTRTDPDMLPQHTAAHASWVRRLTALVGDALPRPEPADLEWRVRSLVACLDGLALNAVTDPAAYPPELQRRVLATHLDLILHTDLTVTPVPGDDPRVRRLVRDLDADLDARYPGDACDGGARLDPAIRFLLAELDGRPAGCCAIQPFPDGAAELKRMYVTPRARGRGVARRLLAEAERVAAAFGHPEIRLETGVHQPEAIALYTRAGYTPIPNYPPYQDEPLSRCYAKRLSG